jgi:hypothetical protein
MKKRILVLALISQFIFSCTKQEIPPDNKIVIKDTIKVALNDLKFKLYPTAADQFTFSVPTDNSKSYKLYLREDNQELANYLLVADKNISGLMNTTVKYNFLPDEIYEIVIRASEENRDTVFQENFTIKEYTHKYLNKFNYEKLVSINQKLDFDISPSRNIIFYIDYINNKCVLKRLSLTDNKLEILDEEFFSLLVRSKNDNELIVYSKKYNNRYLGDDSCALINYDVYSKKSTFIDWGSSDYGRYSRVVNNNIMISNPVWTYSITLVNLSDGSKKKIPANIVSLREFSYDQIYLGNEIFDFTNLNFVNRLAFLNINSSIEYFDENSHYYITTEYFRENHTSTLYSRMIIYKDGVISFELPFERGRSFNLPRITNLDDNKLIFYQSYDYDSEVRLDGYYLLDISTKEISLLQNDGNNYYKSDFFNSTDKNMFISIRPYEIYKITMK